MLKMRLKYNLHGVIGEKADSGNLAPTTVGHTLDVQVQGFGKASLWT